MEGEGGSGDIKPFSDHIEVVPSLCLNLHVGLILLADLYPYLLCMIVRDDACALIDGGQGIIYATLDTLCTFVRHTHTHTHTLVHRSCMSLSFIVQRS